jgi:hypothetical protein
MMIETADRALYLAKNRGKNRVEAYESPAEEAKGNDATEEAT